MAKKRKAKKDGLKDLDPKGRAKHVKGGRTTPGGLARRIVRRSGRAVDQVGDRINETGQAFNRTMNPPS